MPMRPRKISRLPKPLADSRRRRRAREHRFVASSDRAAFLAECRRQSLLLAASDPAGDEAQRFIEAIYEWPED